MANPRTAVTLRPWTANERQISQTTIGPHTRIGVAGCTCVSDSSSGLSNTRRLSYRRGTTGALPLGPGESGGRGQRFRRRLRLHERGRSLLQALAQDAREVSKHLGPREGEALAQAL